MQYFSPNACTPDLWRYLQSQAGRPILLWGMGDGADKVLDVCAEYGIAVADVFASDGFVRGQSFRGRRVLSFGEARATYGDCMIVLLAFGSRRPDVLDNIRRVAAQCELYIPDVPVSGGALFTAELVQAHRADMERARVLLADETSRGVFDGIVRARLGGRLEDIEATATGRAEVWRLLRAESIRTAMDCGAYTGDSLRELIRYAPGLETAVCLEPDVRSFRKLSAYAQALAAEGRAVYPLQAAAWSEDATLTFHDTGNRNASLLPTPQSRERLRQVAAAAPDSAWGCVSAGLPVGGYRRLDFIKYDVEGAERDALLGSRSLIRQDSPRLLVSVYHRSADLWELPLLVRSLYPGASLYLRRMDGVPAWDIELYAVPDEELPAVARD